MERISTTIESREAELHQWNEEWKKNAYEKLWADQLTFRQHQSNDKAKYQQLNYSILTHVVCFLLPPPRQLWISLTHRKFFAFCCCFSLFFQHLCDTTLSHAVVTLCYLPQFIFTINYVNRTVREKWTKMIFFCFC